MKNTTPTQKPTVLVEVINRKMEAQKSGSSSKFFVKFQPPKVRNLNNSSVGPSWGGRKGN